MSNQYRPPAEQPDETPEETFEKQQAQQRGEPQQRDPSETGAQDPTVEHDNDPALVNRAASVQPNDAK